MRNQKVKNNNNCLDSAVAMLPVSPKRPLPSFRLLLRLFVALAPFPEVFHLGL